MLVTVAAGPAPQAPTGAATAAVPFVPRSALLADGWEDPSAPPYDGDKDLGSLYHVTKAIGAHDVWSQHVTGGGVGVALIDSGVAPVTGMAGQVVNGPDLSLESQDAALRHLGSYGHGTHMAGIIAGRDPDAQEGNEHDARKFVGVAPGAHVVNLRSPPPAVPSTSRWSSLRSTGPWSTGTTPS